MQDMFSKPRQSISLFLLATAIANASILGCSEKPSLRETAQRGDLIIAALEKYRADHGQYPPSLKHLSPKYIDKIPSPTWGLREWIYEGDERGFFLMVDESVHTGDGNSRWFKYQGKELGWETGD
jgi:hypothetical protein